MQRAPVLLGAVHGAFRHDDVMLLDHSCYSNSWVTDERVVPDLPVEGGLPDGVKRPGHYPLDVIGEAGEDRRVVRPRERVHVRLHGVLVLAHASPRSRVCFVTWMC